jgi:hypothetical protein
MTNQDYLIIENNVVTNSVMWDGDVQNWTPPTNSILVVQSETQAMVWVVDASVKDFKLEQRLGVGKIGYTWDGNVLTTNEPKPVLPTV